MGGLIILCSIVHHLLYSQLSQDHSHPFCDGRVRHYRILDDYIKIVMKRSEGLKPMQKLVGQLYHRYFAWYLLNSGEVGTNMLIHLPAV